MRNEESNENGGATSRAHSSFFILHSSFSRSVVALALLALLTLAMFADVLFTSQSVVLSQPGTDLSAVEGPVRIFGFERLRRGFVTLWNPHLWSGTAYLGGFDTGLLYPLNVVFLVLPPAKAINVAIALHTWLIGAGMFFLCRQRGMHPLAGFLTGSVTMFSGIYFLHIYAGHLTNLSAMAMAPYIYLGVSLIGSGRRHAGWLIGSAALALQLLACQAQHAFYTCIGAFIYSLLSLGLVRNRIQCLATLALMVAAAILLAAGQLGPAHSYVADSLRSTKGIPYEFAAMFSFPPENLMTLLVPGFFGNMTDHAYWGRCYLWEMCFFVSITAGVISVYGLCQGPTWVRRVALPMILITFLLALGANTPLFRFLYQYVPGFNTLRGNSKFVFQTMLFVTLSAGAGLDVIIRGPRRCRLTAGILVALATALLITGVWAFENAPKGNATLWARIPRSIFETGETYLAPGLARDPVFLLAAGRFAAEGLFIAAGTLMLAAGSFFALRRHPRFLALALCGLSVVEIFCFAHGLRPSFNFPEYFVATGATKIKEFLAARPGDYRILHLADPNSVMMIGAQNIWGYGSTPLRRYVEFIGFTQGLDPDTANQYVQFRTIHRLYSMLRCRYAFVSGTNGLQVVESSDYMPRLNLVTDVRVMHERDAIFRAMADPSFEPRHTVILETPPDPAPIKASAPGNAKLVDSGTDYLVVEAELVAPAILLVTDVYSKGWRATPLAGSVQGRYEVLPANYILRAVPLSAGHHRLRLEYQPHGFVLCAWISIVGGTAYIGLAIWWFRSRARRLTSVVSGSEK
jgi:hypothetical protein